MTKTILLGAGGFLAQEILKRHPDIIPLSLKECDITNRLQVLAVVNSYQPDVIINGAAITDLKFCEQQPLQAWQVNVIGVRHLAEASQKAKAYLVHFSSNYALKPTNEYAWTKLASEGLVKGLVVRSAFYNQTHWLFQALARGQKVKLLTNVYFNPITITSLLNYFAPLIEQRHRGLVNIGVQDKLSFYAFGLAICEVFDFDPQLIEPVTSVQMGYEYPTDTYLDLTTLHQLGLATVSVKQDLEGLKNERC